MKLQFDYAWKWFQFHADQRSKIFNYMLISFGLAAASTVGALNYKMPAIAIGICVIATLFSLVFMILDFRNRTLVHMGEELLANLERCAIFGESEMVHSRRDQPIALGILWRQEREERDWERRSGRSRDSIHGRFRALTRGKHRYWLPFIDLLIALMFAGGAIYVALEFKSFLPT